MRLSDAGLRLATFSLDERDAGELASQLSMRVWQLGAARARERAHGVAA